MCRHQPRGKPLLEKKPSLLCGSVRASERRRGWPPDGPVSALVFRVNVLLPHPPKPRRRPCMVWGLAEEDAMRKLGLNEKRARTKTVRRQHRSEEHTSELQSLMRISYAVFCLKKKHRH